MSYVKIKDHPNLVRDTNSKAVLNVNLKAKEAFIRQRDEQRKVRQVVEEHDQMKADVADIKEKLDLLIRLVTIKD